MVVLLLAACTGDERDAATEASSTVTAPTSTDEHEPEGVGYVPVEECPTTVGTLRSWGAGNWEELTYRKGPLWVALYPRGIVQATSDDVQEDGSIAMKFAWWREARGRLAIVSRRLDAAAAPLRAHIPTGYGRRGFQSTALIFSSPGCWEVTGSLREAKLTFVTRVVAPVR
jgi:hypothetical protein